MTMNRRHVLKSGAAALVAASATAMTATSEATAAEGRSLPIAVEHLRKAMLNADDATLQNLVSEDVTFGHSNGLIQTRDEFIANLVNKVEVFETLNLSDRHIMQHGNVAHERHKFQSDLWFDGKKYSVELQVLQVWVHEDGEWHLFARQAFKA